ncbi:MAG: hypothetical protein QNI93_02535 [Kiloniellales bacterium]|nr:hypothetical protein [Kiloniellales bacterium]
MSRTDADSSGTIEAAALPASTLSPLESVGLSVGGYHAVDNKELGVLMKQKALPMVVAAIFCGLFFGTVMQAGETVFAALIDGIPADPDSLVYVVLACLSLGIGLSAVVVAARRRSQVLQALEAIRRRSAGNGSQKSARR